MINQKRIQLTKLALALSIALSAAPTFAQNTTSAIGGRISGADGKPAGGATVSIVHTESGSVSNVVTDAEGRYVARGLRTGGPYTIIITKNGVSEKREGVYTNLAETSAVDATLGAPIQSVTVTGSAARSEKFARTSMGSGTSISQTELVTQASIQRNLQDYARSDPRVSQTDKERGEISVAGQNSRYNSMTIDGVAVNDTFGLEGNGSPTARQPISIEAIQSVQVNVANYDVTQKGYTGANINAVTKSGTNTWKGAGYFVFRNDKMAGDRYNNVNDTYFNPAPFKEITKGGWVSGPLVQDKLFFFALTEEFSSTRTAPDFGPLGSSAGTTVPITQSSIDSARAIAQGTYGLNIGTVAVPAGTALKVRENMLKLDWNISDDHRMMARYSKTNESTPVFPGLGASSVSLSSYYYSTVKSIETIVAQVFSDWTPNFSTEFKASNRVYDSVPKTNSRLPSVGLNFSGPSPTGALVNPRSINFGTEASRHNNVLGTDTLDLYAGANWSVGNHEIKFGADVNKNRIYNAFLQNVNGTYTFACVKESSSYQYAFNGPAVNFDCAPPTGATPAQLIAQNAANEAATLENFRIGRPSAYTVQVPVNGAKLSDAIANFTLKSTGLFVQDTWNVSPRLTLTYGARLDSASIGETPKENAGARAPMVAGTPAAAASGTTPAVAAVRQSGGFGMDNRVTIDGQKLFQPRFGFNYKLSDTKNMQIRGGAGLFQGAAASVWMSNPFSNPGVATGTYTCNLTSTPNCPSIGGTFNPNPDTQLGSVATPPPSNVDFLDPKLRQPAIWKGNIAFDTELPWMGLVFGTEYLHLKNKDGIYYESLNLGAATRTGPDGRQMFYNPQGYNQANWTSAGLAQNGVSNRALSNTRFANALVARHTSQGAGQVLTFQLSRPMTKGLAASIAYSRTEATEVSPLTSSTSYSNYSGRAVFNPNEEVASNSSYLVKDRVNASVSWSKKFFSSYNTRFGMFYEGRSGKPYSWTVANDLNGDNIPGNDLMYVPSAPGSGEVSFFGANAAERSANEARFWDVVNSDKVLSGSKGGVVGRNTAFAPWTNSFDLRLSQELPGLFKGNKGFFSLDFLNFGNLLNKKWGRIEEIGFQGSSSVGGGNARSFVDYAGLDANGKYTYIVRPTTERFDVKQAKGESQWAIQATVKYEF